ncbi:MAG TPA: cob(I)yrinic acid a,c-diamide adenosyltransferase [Mariniphaga sp.]|nr:cob(I)yrinic acid a,c-diamide adenosyltransferase [Mariniphaga sp.]
MTKKSKIYTKTGDDGTTGLVGGTRVKKYDLRLEAYGTVDELNAAVGVVRSYDMPDAMKEKLEEIQNKLFNIGSRLASDDKGDAYTMKLSITPEHVLSLETGMDEMEDGLPELTQFILPGGEPASAACHVARTICRRAERRILEFANHSTVDIETMRYMNRLSDFLFVFARKLAALNKVGETVWKQL